MILRFKPNLTTKINRKLLSLIFICSALLSSCANSNPKENFQRPAHIMELLDGDNRELHGCSLPIAITEWSEDEDGTGWSRISSWRWNDGITQSEKFEGFPYESRSSKIKNDPQTTLIFIGKWYHLKKINKDIRLIGYQITDKKRYAYGQLRHQFEIRTKENERIKEMSFLPVVKFPGYTHKGDSECAIKWYNKYGYNAIAETKRVWARGFWGKLMLKHELIVTGKVVYAQE